jgi:uncharacterized repeat protein (TIGR02543 family)
MATTNQVVFYPNGGSSVDSQTVAAGDTAAVPDEPTRADYAFEGWFATAEGGQKWDFTVPIDEATTLYAHWTPSRVALPRGRVMAQAIPTAPTTLLLLRRQRLCAPATLTTWTATTTASPVRVHCPQGTGGDTGDDEQDGGAVLPNTGNKVPQGLLPAAVLLLLLGLRLMTGDRRRIKGAAPGPA